MKRGERRWQSVIARGVGGMYDGSMARYVARRGGYVVETCSRRGEVLRKISQGGRLRAREGKRKRTRDGISGATRAGGPGSALVLIKDTMSTFHDVDGEGDDGKEGPNAVDDVERNGGNGEQHAKRAEGRARVTAGFPRSHFSPDLRTSFRSKLSFFQSILSSHFVKSSASFPIFTTCIR